MRARITALTIAIVSKMIFLTGCGPEVKREASTPEKAMVFSLERVSQLVKRYDCQGLLKSEGLEVVLDSRTPITFSPKDGRSSDATFENLSNSHTPGAVMKFGEGERYSFNINVTDTALDLKVDEGLNLIHYKFLGTSAPDEGDIFLKVSYKQTTKSGVSEVHPSAEDCASVR